MQGMIHHHWQAVEMSALIEKRTKHEGVRRLGERISQSQSDEIRFMRRWLATRGEALTLPMPDMGKMGKMKGEMKDHQHHMMMPGMLTPKQMKELAAATGDEFARLFLSGMIQHHIGALVMVDELFKAPGSGQDPEIFTFATDVDSTQRAEIRIMESMLEKMK